MSFFGDRLKEWLNAQGKDQQDLAFDLRWDPGGISKVINGAVPSKGLVERLSEYEPFGVDKETLELWRTIDKVGPRTIKKANEAIETLSKHPKDEVKEAIAKSKTKKESGK